MNKSSKLKNSSKTFKSVKSIKTKETSTLTSRTPKADLKAGISKKKLKHQFKSIPTITLRDKQNSQWPQDQYIYQSYTGKTMNSIPNNSNIEPALLYSVSQRHNSASKVSLKMRLQKQKKATNNINQYNNASVHLSTGRSCMNLSQVFQKTKNVLDSYRKQQKQWKKERESLLKQLQKFRKKQKKRKDSSTTIFKQLRSS